VFYDVLNMYATLGRASGAHDTPRGHNGQSARPSHMGASTREAAAPSEVHHSSDRGGHSLVMPSEHAAAVPDVASQRTRTRSDASDSKSRTVRSDRSAAATASVVWSCETGPTNDTAAHRPVYGNDVADFADLVSADDLRGMSLVACALQRH